VAGFAAAALVIAGLLPIAYNTLAGFTLQSLRQEQETLKQEQTKLEVAEADLLSYTRLEKMATSLKMVDPAPQQVQFLEGNSKPAEARNNLDSLSASEALAGIR
jgi:cell division protein FtsL